jgi:hypothetical protein
MTSNIKQLKLSKENIDKICTYIRDNGAYPSTACAQVGISERALTRYLNRYDVYMREHIDDLDVDKLSDITFEDTLKEPGLIYVYFVEQIKKADATLENDIVKDFKNKVLESNNPIHHAVFLSRRYRERWSEKYDVQVTKNDAERSLISIMEALRKPDELMAPDTPLVAATDPAK